MLVDVGPQRPEHVGGAAAENLVEIQVEPGRDHPGAEEDVHPAPQRGDLARTVVDERKRRPGGRGGVEAHLRQPPVHPFPRKPDHLEPFNRWPMVLLSRLCEHRHMVARPAQAGDHVEQERGMNPVARVGRERAGGEADVHFDGALAYPSGPLQSTGA